MKTQLLLIILLIITSCKKKILVNPDSIKTAKECSKYTNNFNRCDRAFIKEFIGDTAIISIDKNKYLIKEVYLTYMVNHDTVFKHVTNLILKTYDINYKEYDCPNYSNFEIMIDSTKYTLGENSRKLVSEIPISSKYFTLIYFDNNLKKTINFKEKIEN